MTHRIPLKSQKFNSLMHLSAFCLFEALFELIIIGVYQNNTNLSFITLFENRMILVVILNIINYLMSVAIYMFLTLIFESDKYNFEMQFLTLIIVIVSSIFSILVSSSIGDISTSYVIRCILANALGGVTAFFVVRHFGR
jgi:hypothetical protein